MGDSQVNINGQTIDIYYKKARNHRTIQADGAWAGITPQLEVQVAFFKDLRPMPDFVTHLITPGEGLGAEVSRVEQKGMVREVEVTMVMSADTLESVIKLMQQSLEHLKNIKAATPEERAKAGDSEGQS